MRNMKLAAIFGQAEASSPADSVMPYTPDIITESMHALYFTENNLMH